MQNAPKDRQIGENHTPDVSQMIGCLAPHHCYDTDSIRDPVQNASTPVGQNPDQTIRTAYLSYALLVVSCLRLYALWSNGLATRFDVLISLCACSQVIAEILLRAAGETKLPHELVHLETDGGHVQTQLDAKTKTSTLKSFAAFLDKRRASAEVIAIAAILRVSWNPLDTCNPLYGWTHMFAGCFSGTAQLYIRERMQKEHLSLEDSIVCYVGMWIAFLA